MEKFWMVYVEGGKAPEKRHANKCDAIAEAGRLYLVMSKRVYVLEVVGYHDSVGDTYKDSIATIKEGE